MKFEDYYQTLGLERDATQDDIKRAYRKLARKYHPDVSKEPDAEARFKAINEAHQVLKDPETRAAYDRLGSRWRAGEDFEPPPQQKGGFSFEGHDFGAGGFGAGEEFGHSDFFETLFGRRARGARAQPHSQSQGIRMPGQDQHLKLPIDLEDAYRGAERRISLRVPAIDAQGNVTFEQRDLDVKIPKGVRAGQHIRLAGQGGPGLGGAPAGDLYLEIAFNPHPLYRVDGRDVYLDLPLAPWEAALGAKVAMPTPEGAVELTVPAGSAAGRKVRLKGRGIPGNPPGDLYAVLAIALPPADGEAARDAYRAMARTFDDFNPRIHLKA